MGIAGSFGFFGFFRKRCGKQSDQLGKISWRGIHFDLKEGHLEGHLALNVASPAAGSAPSGRSIGSFIVLKTMFIHVYLLYTNA